MENVKTTLKGEETPGLYSSDDLFIIEKVSTNLDFAKFSSMQAWIDEFNKVPLPYKYVQIPHPSDPPNESSPYLKFFVKEWICDTLFAAHV